MRGWLRLGAAVHGGFNAQNICCLRCLSLFSPVIAPHTQNKEFPVGCWTECPHARYSGEDRSSGKTDWRPLKRAFSSSEIFQNQIIKTLRYRCRERSAVRDHKPKTMLSRTPKLWSSNQTTDQIDGMGDRWMGFSKGLNLLGFRIKHNRLVQILKCCFQQVFRMFWHS